MQLLIILLIILIILGVGNYRDIMSSITQPLLLRWEVYAVLGVIVVIIILCMIFIRINVAYQKIKASVQDLQNRNNVRSVVVTPVNTGGKRKFSTSATSNPLVLSKFGELHSLKLLPVGRGFSKISEHKAAFSFRGQSGPSNLSDFKATSPSTYARLLNTVKPVNAMISVKGGRPLVNHILRMCSLIGLDKSLGLVKVIITFMNFCFKYIKHNGLKGLVIYLKACTVILQQASGKHKLQSMNGLNIRFARTRSGYPRVIPILHRTRIHEPKIFKLWMTLFSLYRVLEVPGKLKLSTIVDPSRMDPSILPRISQSLERGFWPALSSLPGFDDTKIGLNWLEPWDFLKGLRAVPFMIAKSSSAAGYIRITKADKGISIQSTSPASILAAVVAWIENPHMFKILKDWCTATGNIWLLNRIDSWNRILIPMVDPTDKARYSFYKGMRTVLGQTYARSLGRLGFKEEAAGKVRVFAYVDPFTQWLLKPIHDALFELLALIPEDGTSDQLAPVRRLISRNPLGPYFSYDLTAATDRLPIIVQMTILSKIMTA